ncbi:MAG TPA: hypothetical protein VK550_34800 [Polyangiaceae bacterium]|nr:hypothetical protein [Polyangiaceae bacterium]
MILRSLVASLVSPLAISAAVALTACGSASLAPRDTIVVKTEVHVLRVDRRERLGIQPEEARVAAAATSLEKTLGHPVLIEVDAALLPSSKSAVIRETADSLETLAKAFAVHARRDPLVSAFVHDKLVRVAARYRASAEHPTSSFDDATGTLVCTMREPSSGGWFTGSYDFERTLEEAYARHLAAHFAKTGAEVADTELEAYFRHLTTSRGDRTHGEREEDRAARVLAVLAFETRTRGKRIHEEVEKFLVDQAHWLLAAENQGAERSTVRASYARFVDERFFAVTSHLRRTLYEHLFREANCTGERCPRLPELDRVPIALAFFARNPPADEGDFDAFDQALCLYQEKEGKIERNRSCADIYEFLTETDLKSERLVTALLQAKRRDLLIAALVNADKHMPSLLRALERSGGALYADALRMLTNLDSYRFRDQVYVLRAEVTRIWPSRPDLRPILLRLVADDYAQRGYRDEQFAKLPDEFASLDAALFAQFLDEGPRSVDLAPMLWPALRHVTTPFEIVAARLDGYVAKRGLEASKTIAALVRRACQAKDLEGLRVLRVALQKRANGGDKDALALALAARDCKP